MSGAVKVITEPDGTHVVGCFVYDPDTQQPMCQSPWVSEHGVKSAANLAARLHRQEHRDEIDKRRGKCPTCGQMQTADRPTPIGLRATSEGASA